MIIAFYVIIPPNCHESVYDLWPIKSISRLPAPPLVALQPAGYLQNRESPGESRGFFNLVQTIDYLYDIRGWLTKINDIDNPGREKLFTQQLSYYSNGNVLNVLWRQTSAYYTWEQSFPKSQYFYIYDNLNRLIGGLYRQYLDSGSTDYGNFSTSYFYDLNGNIKGLLRHWKIFGDATWEQMDNLKYSYLEHSNQLDKIDEVTHYYDIEHDLHFHKEWNGHYQYDANGNSISVPARETVLQYNYLNLPSEISVSTKKIAYIYDAAGNKLKKTAGELETWYLGNLIKHNDMDILLTEEGRALKYGEYGEWRYEYNLKDHLGNTRVSFGVDTTRAIPLQYKDYYPFGLEMAKWYETDPNATKYLYNGKELQDDYQLNLYDYGARFYDPVTARFTTPDPHAENYYSWSPYHYAANNPMLVTDPTGMDWFVNRENGNVLFVNGVEELTEELIERYGEGYDHFGSDDMFGNEVTVEGEDGNILDRPDYEFGPTGGEEFMESQGYNKGERVQMEKTEFETNVYNDGTLGVRTISENSEVQVGDSEITYVKPSEFGKKENTTTNSYRDDNFTLKKENYSVVKRPGTKVKNRYRSPFQVVKDLLGIGTNIVSNKAEKK